MESTPASINAPAAATAARGVQASGLVVQRSQAVLDPVVRPHLGPHGAHHRARQGQAPPGVTAVAVVAAVDQRRQELAEQVAVGAVDLHQVVAGPHAAAGGAGEAARVLLDLGDRRGAALLLAAGHDAGGGADRLVAAAGAGHLASAVVELHAGHRARRPDPLAETGVPGDQRVVVDAELVVAGAAFGHHVAVLDHHQAHAGVRARHVAVQVLLRHRSVRRRQVACHRRHHDPVAQRAALDRDRRQQAGRRRADHAGLLCVPARAAVQTATPQLRSERRPACAAVQRIESRAARRGRPGAVASQGRYRRHVSTAPVARSQAGSGLRPLPQPGSPAPGGFRAARAPRTSHCTVDGSTF